MLFALTVMLSLSSYSQRKNSIVILFDNDVHCGIDGYAKLAGLRDAVRDTAWTAVASCGDFLQGGTAGAISKGQYIVDIMKHVDYTAVTLGNHEFDYKMPRMFELLDQLGATVVSANLIDIATGERVFAPYVIKEMGGKKVAFIGMTTPTTLDTESYAFFDGTSHQVYDLMPLNFWTMIQGSIDAARTEGADYVIAICHLGEDPTDMNVESRTLIAKTTGLDVVLDGHTHNVIQPMWLPDKGGHQVLTMQTGTQFANVGKLLISADGKISAELVPVETIDNTNADVQAAIDSVKAQMQQVVSRHICHSEVDLRILDDEGAQLVRRAETNAGDIVADAFRIMTGADIAMNNSGGIRNELKKGDLTYGDIVSLLPYDNYLCTVEVTGAKILELLTANTSILPLEDGQFPQVSGLRFTAVTADHSVCDV